MDEATVVSESARRASFGTAARLFAGRVTVMVVQVGFMAVSARLLTPADFGAYAAALVALGLVSVLFADGLSTAIVVRSRFGHGELRGLASASMLLGLLIGVMMWVLAPAWAALWRIPETVSVTRAIALAALFSPYLALLLGMARRYGRIRGYALAVLVSGVVSVLVALGVMLAHPTTLTLVIQPVLSAILLVLTHRWWLGVAVPPTGMPGHAVGHVRPALRDTVFLLVDFLTVNAGAWAIGASAGSSVLGVWNRASTLSQAPLMMLRGSITEALFEASRSPTGRIDPHSRRTPDLAIQAAVALGVASAVALYVVTPWILGPQWVGSAGLTVPLALYMGLLVASTRGSVALRSTQQHASLLLLWSSSLVPLGVGLVMTIDQASPWPVAWAYVLQGLVLVALLELVRERGMPRSVARVAPRMAWIVTMLLSGISMVAGLAMNDSPMTVRIGVFAVGMLGVAALIVKGGLAPAVAGVGRRLR